MEIERFQIRDEWRYHSYLPLSNTSFDVRFWKGQSPDHWWWVSRIESSTTAFVKNLKSHWTRIRAAFAPGSNSNNKSCTLFLVKATYFWLILGYPEMISFKIFIGKLIELLIFHTHHFTFNNHPSFSFLLVPRPPESSRISYFTWHPILDGFRHFPGFGLSSDWVLELPPADRKHDIASLTRCHDNAQFILRSAQIVVWLIAEANL